MKPSERYLDETIPALESRLAALESRHQTDTIDTPSARLSAANELSYKLTEANERIRELEGELEEQLAESSSVMDSVRKAVGCPDGDNILEHLEALTKERDESVAQFASKPAHDWSRLLAFGEAIDVVSGNLYLAYSSYSVGSTLRHMAQQRSAEVDTDVKYTCTAPERAALLQLARYLEGGP